MTGSSIVRRVHVGGRQGCWQIDAIVPSSRFQHRLSVFSVVIQQGFQISFLMVRIRLWADDDLLEQCVCRVVDGEQIFGYQQIATGSFLQS